MIPQPPPEPLGVLVRDSKTIHVLQVEHIKEKGVSFKIAAALKGKPAEAPFRFVAPLVNGGCEGLFRAGASVLCLRQGDVAILFTGRRWALAIEPNSFRRETDWFCLSEHRYGVIYDGTVEALREHVVAILAGRETTITARAPQAWGAVGGPRLWRIKASLKVTDFVLSDESPHFVGWGSGGRDEVPNLLRALRAGAPQERIAAARDLAHLGPGARPALAGLRRASSDDVPEVALAAAQALARLEASDDRPIKTIEQRLRHAGPKVRCAAAEALGELGPRGRPALPALLRALKDKNEGVRHAAVTAIGRIAPGSPLQREAVGALTALLKAEKGAVASTVLPSLPRFGPHAWTTVPIVRERLSALGEGRGWHHPDVDAVAFLARLSPPPIELLAEVLEDRRSSYAAQQAVARQLRTLGRRASLALPSLRRALRAPQEAGDDRRPLRLTVAETLLAIDPEGAPALVAPVLLALAKEPSPYHLQAVRLLGRCGAAARPSLPALLGSLDPESSFGEHTIRDLTPLLGPEDRKLLPALRRLVGPQGDSLTLAEVLLRLGHRREALGQAARCLKSESPDRQIAAARWLGERGPEAKAVEPPLRQALARAEGAERARLALTLWRVRGAKGAGPHARALAALDDLLASCEGEPAVGPIPQRAFWAWRAPATQWQEDAAVGNAVATVHGRLHAGGETVAVLARFLWDKRPHVRLAAAVTLARAEPRHPETIVALQRLLERHPHFFCYAADALAALGPRAAPLAPLLLPTLYHPNDDVYRATDRVLRRISPEVAAKGWGAAAVPGAVPADLGPLWDDLAARDPLRADLAVWRLAGGRPRTVALLRERLRPPPALPPKRIARLINDLDSDDFDTRERASAELARALESAAPALRRARSAGPSLELRRRIDRLLAELSPPRTPEHRRRLRALRLLEEMGGPDSRALLERLSRRDPRSGWTWEEAAAALRRLDRP
jgi:hypothetical protein